MAFEKELTVEHLSEDPWLVLYHPIPQDADAQLLNAICRYAQVTDFSEELTEVSIKEGGRVEVTGFPTLGLPW